MAPFLLHSVVVTAARVTILGHTFSDTGALTIDVPTQKAVNKLLDTTAVKIVKVSTTIAAAYLD